MAPTARLHDAAIDLMRSAGRWLAGWWRIVHLAALLLAMALSPSSYTAAMRAALARHVYFGTAPTLLWFGVLTSLISTVVIRIVLVTSVSYGLTQYALQMVVRVLVLELIPLTAALFAALRCTMPLAAQVAVLRAPEAAPLDAWRDTALLQREVLPRAVAGLFSALMLAAMSCVVTLVAAYLSVHGLAMAGFDAFTRTVGHVFNPVVSLIFGLKIVLLAFTVALLPIAAVLEHAPHAQHNAELQGLVRMFLVILLIEAASLVGNYY